MLLSVLPTTALAAEGDASETPTAGHTSVVSAESDDKAVHVIKSVDGNTLTLEAYATNTISKQTSYEPLDIVLVLDVSSSMDEKTLPSYEYRKMTKTTWSYKDVSKDKDYYILKDGTYHKVSRDYSWHFSYTTYWLKADGQILGKKVYNDRDIAYTGVLYERVNTAANTTKLKALQDAVNAFIDSVANQKDSKDNTIDNQISLIKFAGTKSKDVGNTIAPNGENLTQVVMGLTNASTGRDTLKAAVNSLKPAGVTAADWGMQLANDVLTGRANEDKTRKSVVIMFTDGEPNHWGGFDPQVASDAIAAAKTLKDGGTLVYTIGVFGNNKDKNTDTYMDAVSSNYPNASYVDEGEDKWWGHDADWKWYLGEREKDGNYYRTASTAGDLSDIFQAISQEISSLAVKVDESSVLSDTLSDMFTFNPPAGATGNGITVTKVPVTGKDADGNYTWGTAEPSDLTAEINGKTVTVKGFDYGKNAVTTKTEGEEVIYSGCKLVVTIPIKPDTGYTRWTNGENYYDTNAAGAGLTYGDENQKPRPKVELTDSPKAPVTAYTVSYTYTGDVPSTVSGFEDGYYIAGQEATVKNEPDSPVTENGFTYTFGGWTSDEIRDGKISITDHNVTVTGNWTKTALTATVTIEKKFDAPEGDTAFTAPNSLRIKLVPEDTSKNAIYLTGGHTYTSSNIPAGTYKVEEENETVDGYNCSPTLAKTGTTPDLNDNGTITVAAGGTYTYELTNTYTANQPQPDPLTVKKSAMVKHYKQQENGSYELSAPEALGENVMVGDVIVYTIEITNNTKKEIKADDITITDTFNGTGDDTNGLYHSNADSKDHLRACIDFSKTVDNTKIDGTKTYTIVIEDGTIPAGETRKIELVYPVQYDDTEDPAELVNTASVKYEGEDYGSNEVKIPVNTDTFNLVVQKQWFGANYSPTVEVQLYKDGQPEGDTIKIVADKYVGAVRGMFSNLPLCNDGEKIIYTVKEIDIADATLIEKDVKPDFDDDDYGDAKCDVFETNDKSGKWYAVYADQDASDGRVAILNCYEKVEPNAELTVTKKILKDGELVDTVRAKIGEDITYVVTITNSGNIPLSGLKLEENFSGGHGTLDGVYKDLNDDTTKIELDSNQEVELPGTLEPGKSVTYYLKYTVHADDTQVRNSVTVNPTAVTGFRPAPSDTVYVNVNRGDVDGYNVTGLVYKIVRSDKGTYNPDEDRQEFKFVIWKDEDCTEKLHNFPIYFTDTVKEGKEETKDGKFSFEISLDDYNDLGEEEIDGVTYKVVYLTELEGDDEKMTYSTTPIKLYIVRDSGEAQIAALFGLNIIGGEHGEITAVANPRTGEWANVTNIYNKKYEKPVKVGPQLNRDDHVAYIMGYPDGTVQPEGEITRAEACTIFFRLLTDSSRDYYFSKTNDYSDVNAGDWFNNAISTLSNAGIVTGYNDGTFRPNQPITRGEMAKIIANFANLKHGDKTFTDLAGHWSKSYVELAAGNGWIAGYPDGSFRPDQKITRAETVTMINRVLERVPAKESRLLSRSIMLTFPDNNPGDWYYIAIQEASNSHEYQRSVYETTGDEMWTKLIDNVDWTKLEK